MVTRSHRWRTCVFAVPCFLVAALGLLQVNAAGLVIAALFGYAAVAVVMDLFGRYSALCLGLSLWVGIGIAFANVVLPLVGMAVGGALAVILVLWAILRAIRIGAVWGQGKADHMRARGRPMREWEWVYTGREFALAHPLAAGLGPIWSVLGFVVIQWVVFGWAAWVFAVWTGFVFYSFVAALAILTLLRRHPSAWVLTWWPLLVGLPLSLPLIVYWVDGVRPNLIYRHRFERLIPVENARVQ